VDVLPTFSARTLFTTTSAVIDTKPTVSSVAGSGTFNNEKRVRKSGPYTYQVLTLCQMLDASTVHTSLTADETGSTNNLFELTTESGHGLSLIRIPAARSQICFHKNSKTWIRSMLNAIILSNNSTFVDPSDAASWLMICALWQAVSTIDRNGSYQVWLARRQWVHPRPLL
jgi:hypothetical protein